MSLEVRTVLITELELELEQVQVMEVLEVES